MLRVALLIACCFGIVTGARSAGDDAIGQLISELGSEQFPVRRRAEQELIRLGPDAFDQLKLAADHPDLEVSERVRYILERLRVEWTAPDDSSEVRRLLARYGDLSEDEKNDRIVRLAALPRGEGLEALCRIARLDRSPLMSRRAALAVLRQAGADDAVIDADACLEALGASERAPVAWIRAHLQASDSPESAAADLASLVDAEQQLLAQGSSETNFLIVRELLDRHLQLCARLKLTDQTLAALVRSMQFIDARLADTRNLRNPESRADLIALMAWGVDMKSHESHTAGLSWAIRWILKHRQWDVLPPLKDRYGDKLDASRQLLYLVAAATEGAGDAAEAARLAEQAFAMKADDEDERVAMAETLARLGRVDWAEREFRRTIENSPATEGRAMKARYELASWLFDRQQFKEAADLLSELSTSIGVEERQQLRRNLIERSRSGLSAVDLATFEARQKYYLAFHYEAEGEYAKQRQCLLEAIALSDDDPDILIAMHRSPGADEEFRQRTLELIQAMSAQLLEAIEQYPHDPNLRNQWAWLIGNTEGDYQRAVEYSQRSLELNPDEPSFLDTLGRCHYAAGDLENAVKSQRRAVELAPHYGVMRRQLEQFESELAAREKRG